MLVRVKGHINIDRRLPLARFAYHVRVIVRRTGCRHLMRSRPGLRSDRQGCHRDVKFAAPSMLIYWLISGTFGLVTSQIVHASLRLSAGKVRRRDADCRVCGPLVEYERLSPAHRTMSRYKLGKGANVCGFLGPNYTRKPSFDPARTCHGGAVCSAKTPPFASPRSATVGVDTERLLTSPAG